MALTDYTSYAEIRAVLGVAEDEIDDATLELGVYSLNLLAEFEDISSTLLADYAIVALIDAGDRTALQAKLFNAVQLFAPYAVGKQLASSLPIFSPHSITDGKSGFTRYADSPYKQAIAECLRQYSANRQRLADAYAGFTSTDTAIPLAPYLTISSPATDPVTG